MPHSIIAIVFSLICTMLLGTFPGWRTEDDGEGSEREVKPFPSRPVSQLALGFIGISSLLGLASAFWQHIGSSGATTLTRLLTYDMVEARVGATGMVFGWLGASCAGITTIGLFIMILSIRVLEQLSN